MPSNSKDIETMIQRVEEIRVKIVRSLVEIDKIDINKSVS